MKQITLLTLLLFSLLGCSQEKPIEVNSIVPLGIQQEKQITYGIEISSQYPYELYINDIKVDESENGGSIAVEMNPWILSNGIYKVRFILFPYDNTLSTDAIKHNSLIFSKVILGQNPPQGQRDIIEREIIKELTLSIPEEPVKKFEQTWEVEITDLPYELTGWSKSRDLRKMDSTVLKQKVVAYYQKLWNILNKGDADAWFSLDKKRDEETYIFNYTSKDSIIFFKNETKEMIEKESKNNMLPLEDYTMQIYADGRLVRLERNATKEFEGHKANIKGWSPLIYNDEGLITSLPITLHMPPAKKSMLADESEWGDFEIIRK